MKSKCLAILVGLALFQLPARSQVVITSGGASQTQLLGFNSGGEFVPAQTFSLSHSARLNSVGLYLSLQNGTQATSFTFDLRSTASGTPSSVIATATASNAALTTSPTLLTADFSAQNLLLTAGVEYAIAAHPLSGSVWIYGDTTNPYPNGSFYTLTTSTGSWSNSAASDAGFAISVVPEPSSLQFGVMGFGLLLATGRQRFLKKRVT